MGTEAIGYVLGQQCAPVLAGIKPSNLLILEQGNRKGVRRVLRGTQLCCCLLCSSAGKDYWLLFDPYEMARLLIQPETADYLRTCGYEPENLGAVLRNLSERFGRYKETGENFPHEMGVLFGYPLGDVKGFIEHKGRDFKKSGYWKVYGDVAYASRMFDLYEKARRTALALCGRGLCIREIRNSLHREGTTEWAAAG